MVVKAFSIEHMTQDSALAREFLAELEVQSHNFIDPSWREMTEMEIIEKACFSYHILSNEMDAAQKMSLANAIH